MALAKEFDLMPTKLKSNSLYDFAFKIIYYSGYEGSSGPMIDYFGGPKGSNSYVQNVTVLDKPGNNFSLVTLDMSMDYESCLKALDVVSTGDAIDLEFGYMPGLTRRLQCVSNGNPCKSASLGSTSSIQLEFIAHGGAVLGKTAEKFKDVNQFDGQTFDDIAEAILGEYGFSADMIIYHHNKETENRIKTPFIIDSDSDSESFSLPTRDGTTDWEFLVSCADTISMAMNPQFGEVHIEPLRDYLSDADYDNALIEFKMNAIVDQTPGWMDGNRPVLPISNLNYKASTLAILQKPFAGSWDLKTGEFTPVNTVSNKARGDADTIGANTSGTGDADNAGVKSDVKIEDTEYTGVHSGLDIRATSSPNGMGATSIIDSVWGTLGSGDTTVALGTIGYPNVVVNMKAILSNCGRLDGVYIIKEIEHKFGQSAYTMIVTLIPGVN